MMGELVSEGSALEVAQMLLLVVAMGFAVMVPPVWIAGRTIALKEKPDKRALWTTAIGYIVAFFVFLLATDGFISPWSAPFIPLPGAIVIFFWLRNTYRKGWVEEDDITEGMSLENSDWRVGLAVVVGAIVAATIKVALTRI